MCILLGVCDFPLSKDVCDTPDLLKHSAVLIANWNINCTLVTWKLLQSTNRPILVRVLTHHGPEYWGKQLTINCYRHSSEIYYTARFADLFYSLLLINEARIKKSVDKLHFLFGDSNLVSGLLPT